MICQGCLSKTATHIRLYSDGTQICNNCSFLSASFSTDGLLTRNSERVRLQQAEHAADMVQPHVYNRDRRKLEINPEFVKLYPDKMRYYFKEDEVAAAGMPKLAKAMEVQKTRTKEIKEAQVEFAGSPRKAIKRLLK